MKTHEVVYPDDIGTQKERWNKIPGVGEPTAVMRPSLNPLSWRSNHWSQTGGAELTPQSGEKIVSVRHSGASCSCAPPSLVPDAEMCECLGSQSGLRHHAASGNNLG